jgi:hypothetical protein
MDSLITAAVRALAAGDLLGALNRVALRDDPPALALRSIAMARLGDLDRAKALLRSAARAFGPKRPWPARGVSSPRPKSRSSRATWAGLRRRSTQLGRLKFWTTFVASLVSKGAAFGHPFPQVAVHLASATASSGAGRPSG